MRQEAPGARLFIEPCHTGHALPCRAAHACGTVSIVLCSPYCATQGGRAGPYTAPAIFHGPHACHHIMKRLAEELLHCLIRTFLACTGSLNKIFFRQNLLSSKSCDAPQSAKIFRPFPAGCLAQPIGNPVRSCYSASMALRTLCERFAEQASCCVAIVALTTAPTHATQIASLPPSDYIVTFGVVSYSRESV